MYGKEYKSKLHGFLLITRMLFTLLKQVFNEIFEKLGFSRHYNSGRRSNSFLQFQNCCEEKCTVFQGLG